MLTADSRLGRDRLRCGLLAAVVLVAGALLLPGAASAARSHLRISRHSSMHFRRMANASAPGSTGELDCNGFSTVQQPARPTMNCTDVRGFNNLNNANTWDGRFYDNNHYIGHDEPDMTFLSRQPGSGNDITWTETLGRDPTALPTVAHPGSDVAHWFELTAAPWFSMAMCDPKSYPRHACHPESDANAPHGSYTGAGSAFMEMQLYPPGWSPFADAISCDNAHWCAALTIDSLECTLGFKFCNQKCTEPINFAWIQTNGVPTGPAAPLQSNLATLTPNANTLLMNPGDTIHVHMFDAAVPGGGGARAFEVQIYDQTTGQSGFMQASAANGFANTSINGCKETPFNFQPEYNTAQRSNIVPWAALQTDVSTEFEIGHFTPCTSLSSASQLLLSPTVTDTYWNYCHGPYERTTQPDGGSNPEVSDAPCYPMGDTHGMLNTPPDEVTGCYDTFAQNGDLDFDGSSYWPEWPVSASPTSNYPGSFVQALPQTRNNPYSQYFIQTDVALSESTCSGTTTHGCGVPPPNAPGHFYPYWSRVNTSTGCVLEFGNVSGPGADTFGKDDQYGTDQVATLGYPEFIGPIRANTCSTGPA